jgi:uncharacterized protein (UPF0548 family)
MRISRPSPADIRALIAKRAELPVTYPDTVTTRSGPVAPPPGYDLDHNRARLGHGPETFDRARAALERWAMFPPGWTAVWNRHGERAGADDLLEGAVVASVLRAWGLWWVSPCRVVFTVDDEEASGVVRFGFAYGTLPGHPEEGEERFSVELWPDGSVWYDLLAVSRPRAFAARLGRPLARQLQRRFQRDSRLAMEAAVASPSEHPVLVG